MATLRERIQAIPGYQEKLDALVHDQASQLATAINNDGVGNQMEFLTDQRGMSDDEILEALKP